MSSIISNMVDIIRDPQEGGYNPQDVAYKWGPPTGRYKPPNPQNHETEYIHHSNSQLPSVFPRSLD